MQGSTPDPIEGVDLTGDEPDPSLAANVTEFSEQERPVGLPLADAEEPTSTHGVIREEHETTKFSVTFRLKEALVNAQYSEHARRTSWVGAFFLVVAVAIGAALAFNKWVVGAQAALPIRITVAACCFGVVLAAGLGFLAFRDRKRH